MPQFTYRAVNATGRVVRGTIVATNDLDLYQRLRDVGLELLSAREASSFLRVPAFLQRLKARDLIQLCIHLGELTRAGAPLLEGLADVRDSTDSPPLRNAMLQVHREVGEGVALSDAFAKHPRIFEFLFVALIRAGERTGNLTESFGQLTRHLKWHEQLRSRIRKATRYPLFSFVFSLGLVLVMMTLVVPQVIDFLKSMNIPMPAITKALIATSDFFVVYWAAVAATPFLIMGLIKLLSRLSDGFALWFDRFKLQLPLLGPVIHKIALSRFSHFFAIMFRSGIDILVCLEAAQQVVGNRALATSLGLVRQGVQGGTSLSESMDRTGEFPRLVLRMVKIGEDTGNLSATLEQVTEFYDQDVDDRVDAIVQSIQPTITVIVGLIIGWVLVAVLMPVYDNLNKMGVL